MCSMGVQELLSDVLLRDVGMTKERAIWWSQQNTLDGNPSINHVEGTKQKVSVGDTVIVTKYGSPPCLMNDMPCVVTDTVMADKVQMLRVITAETGIAGWIRRDGVRKVDMDDTDDMRMFKTAAMSLTYYEPRREARSVNIAFGIAVTTLINNGQ